MSIFSHSGIVTPQDDKTNIVLPFTVPEGVTALDVCYSYTPKTLENREAAEAAVRACMAKYGVPLTDINDYLPVNNLLTLSFDDPVGYRGACHRQPNEQQIHIGMDSTPGILNRPVIAGAWRIVLNAHYIGCDVGYHITVEGVSI